MSKGTFEIESKKKRAITFNSSPSYGGSHGRDSCEVRNVNSVYVDIKYGSSCGKLNNPSRPFQNVQQAVNAILEKTGNKRPETRWIVHLGAGYNGKVKNTLGNISFRGDAGIISEFGPITVNDNVGVVTIESVTLFNGMLFNKKAVPPEGERLIVELTDVNVTMNGKLTRPYFDAYGVTLDMTTQDCSHTLNSTGESMSNKVFRLGGGGANFNFLNQGNSFTLNSDNDSSAGSFTTVFIDRLSSGSSTSHSNSFIVNSSVDSIVPLEVSSKFTGSALSVNENIQLNKLGSGATIFLVKNNSSTASVSSTDASVSSPDVVPVVQNGGSSRAFISKAVIHSTGTSATQTPIGWGYKTISTDYDVQENDSFIILTGDSGSVTALLPPVKSQDAGKTYVFKNNSKSGALIILAQGSDKINNIDKSFIEVFSVPINVPTLSYSFTSNGVNTWL